MRKLTALTKAFDILELFLDNRIEMSLAEITKLSGFNKTTVFRLLSDMVEYGYIHQKVKGGNYRLGNKFFDFCGYIKSSMKTREVCIPFLVQLGRKVEEACALALWDGRKAVISETFHANQPLRVVPDEGSSLPLHCTAPGKMILANMKENEQSEYMSENPLKAFTPNTITDIKDLKKHLGIVKREGVALEFDEYATGISGIAAPIKDISGDIIGSIGVVGPSARLIRTKIKRIIPEIKKCALEISEEIGFRNE